MDYTDDLYEKSRSLPRNMSFDQLPNELIAHIGSFLSFKDNIQFGLCQKRIHAVLKRDGLLKPECKTLRFTNATHQHCNFWLPNSSTKLSIAEENRDPKFNSVVGQIINKFRKIEVIDFRIFGEKMTEDILKDLMKTKTKLRFLLIIQYKVDIVDPNIFIAACKKFNKIQLHWTILPTELLCDQVFVELMPIMTFVNSVYGPFDGYLLTDRTLNALTVPKVKQRFDIGRILTSFTIAGIKNLVQEILKAIEDVHVMYHPRHRRYGLGILKFSEERNAVRWMEEVAADPDCPYIIVRYPPFETEMDIVYYSIRLKNDARRRYFAFHFAINQVEA